MNHDASVGTFGREHLGLAIRAAGLGAVEWRKAEDVFLLDERAGAIFRLDPGLSPGQDGTLFYDVVHETDRDRIREAVEAALDEARGFDLEYRITIPEEAPPVWVRVVGVSVTDEDGETKGAVAIVEDISERKIEDSRRLTLMSELDHRVKNVLAAVQALAFQTAKRTTSLDSFLQTFAGRLKSMGSANELLTAARWRGAAIDHLAAAELGGIAPSQARWEGPELFLTPRAANALSLALHELATNALKFGALATDHGRIDVRWGRLPDGGFELLWIESGGAYVQPPSRLGFGSTLLNQVTGRELNGQTEIEYNPSGLRARLRAGPSAVVERPETVPQAPPQRTLELQTIDADVANLKGARILIVEDAVLLALELETGLQEAGAKIIGPAYELEEAKALLDQKIDAAVLDANLNGQSVTPVAEALAARGIPFVFATGYGGAGGAPTGFDAPVIRKPYDVTQVAAAVGELLAKSSGGRSAP